MHNTPEFIWDSIKGYYNEKIVLNYPSVRLDESKKKIFIDFFSNEYTAIMNNYMKKSVKTLDRHKQAAIIIADIICNNILINEVAEKRIFIGLEQTALLVGLSFLRDQLNPILKKNGIGKITKFSFPEPMSCDTNYFDVLTRDLYFQKRDNNNSIYILLLAHILFQIEYLTLIENNIDPKVLKE